MFRKSIVGDHTNSHWLPLLLVSTTSFPLLSSLHLTRLLLLPGLLNKASYKGNRFFMESQAQKNRKKEKELAFGVPFIYSSSSVQFFYSNSFIHILMNQIFFQILYDRTEKTIVHCYSAALFSSSFFPESQGTD